MPADKIHQTANPYYLKFRIGDCHMAISLHQVWMILDGERVEGINNRNIPHSIMGKIHFHNRMMPVIDPADKLPVQTNHMNLLDMCLLMIPASKGSIEKGFYGLPVDQVIGKEKIQEKNIQKGGTVGPYKNPGHNLIGSVLIHDQPFHIVNPEKLLNSNELIQFQCAGT